MKKRIILLIVVVALLVMSLTACSVQEANPVNDVAMEMTNFKSVEGKEYLSYDTDTRVVYYMFSTHEHVGNKGFGYTYFAPYISENGRFCQYINGEIVEIVDTNN